MIGTELGSDAIHEKFDLPLCKVRTLQESCDSLRTSHGTFLLATAHATPFFDGTGQRWEIQKNVKSESYTTRIQDHESTKNTKIFAVVQDSCFVMWHANRVWNHSGLHVALQLCVVRMPLRDRARGTWWSWIDMNCLQHAERFQI